MGLGAKPRQAPARNEATARPAPQPPAPVEPTAEPAEAPARNEATAEPPAPGAAEPPARNEATVEPPARPDSVYPTYFEVPPPHYPTVGPPAPDRPIAGY